MLAKHLGDYLNFSQTNSRDPTYVTNTNIKSMLNYLKISFDPKAVRADLINLLSKLTSDDVMAITSYYDRFGNPKNVGNQISEKKKLETDVLETNDTEKEYIFEKEKEVSFVLLCIAELGAKMNLQFRPDLHLLIAEQFSNESSMIQNSACYALGHLAFFQFYFDFLVKGVQTGKILYLKSLGEFIQSFTKETKDEILKSCWNLLLSEEVSMATENQNLISDSLAKIVLLQPEFLDELMDSFEKSNQEKIIAVSAYKSIIVHSDSNFDRIIQSEIPKLKVFIKLFETSKVTIEALEAIIARKPELIKSQVYDFLDLIYPLLEFRVLLINKEELVEYVQIGPFKHEVDQGLDTRRKAFDFLGLLYSLEPIKLPPKYFSKLALGISDRSIPIKMKSYSIIETVLKKDATKFEPSLEFIVQEIRKSVFYAVKDMTVKQDLEEKDKLRKISLKLLKTFQKSYPDQMEVLVKEVLSGELAIGFNNITLS